MLLVDEGKVKLDDPVEKYLPEFKGQMLAVERDAEHARAHAAARAVQHVEAELRGPAGRHRRGQRTQGALDVIRRDQCAQLFAAGRRCFGGQPEQALELQDGEGLGRGKQRRLEHALHEVEVERLALGGGLRGRRRDGFGGFDGVDGFVGHGQVIVSVARSLFRRT